MNIGFKLLCLVLMILTFLGAAILPLGIIVLLWTVPLTILITIIQSYRQRSWRFVKGFLLPILLSGLVGFGILSYKNYRQRADIYEIAGLIDQYYQKHHHLPSQDDPMFKNYGQLSIYDDENPTHTNKRGYYSFHYNGDYYDSKTKEIYVRPI